MLNQVLQVWFENKTHFFRLAIDRVLSRVKPSFLSITSDWHVTDHFLSLNKHRVRSSFLLLVFVGNRLFQIWKLVLDKQILLLVGQICVFLKKFFLAGDDNSVISSWVFSRLLWPRDACFVWNRPLNHCVLKGSVVWSWVQNYVFVNALQTQRVLSCLLRVLPKSLSSV